MHSRGLVLLKRKHFDLFTACVLMSGMLSFWYGFAFSTQLAPSIRGPVSGSESWHLRRTNEKEETEVEWPPAINELLEEVGGFSHWGQTLDIADPMNYGILQKPLESALLGSISEHTRLVCDHDRLFHPRTPGDSAAAWAVSAALLWLLREYDACHEVTLGTFNLRGPSMASARSFINGLKDTMWIHRHKVCPEQVLLHAALHRFEGPLEADKLSLSGYENSKIWYSRLDPRFSVLEDLVVFAQEHAPDVAARCVVSKRGAQRRVPVRIPGLKGEAAWAGPGRMVQLDPGLWDPYAFVDLCLEINDAGTQGLEGNSDLLRLHSQALLVQQRELASCFRRALRRAL